MPGDWLVAERKIALTGIAGGGKTVFLTALLSHLLEHDPYHFAFGRQAQVSKFKELRPRSGYGEAFRLDAARDFLARQRLWPAKTRDCSHYACQFQRSDRPYRASRLHFFDMPGERVADASVAGHEHYADWADHILQHLRDHSAYAQAAQPYFDLLSDKPLEEATLLHAYKLTLGRLILGYKPLISPSTFLLDQVGGVAQGSSPEALAQCRLSGLPAEGEVPGEFAPLDKAARQAQPELAARFAQAYKRYRQQVALPVFRELKSASRLIVLVDVPSLLVGGDGRYNDNRQMLHDLFEALRPGSWLAARLLAMLGLRSRPLERVAFVAAKADLVRPEDIENGRLSDLLQAMTNRARRLLPDVHCEWFAASACISTRRGQTPESLIGRPAHSAPEGPEMAFEVSALPQDWPAAWQPGEFAFYRVHPQAPRNLQIPPPHLGLDRIFDFITAD